MKFKEIQLDPDKVNEPQHGNLTIPPLRAIISHIINSDASNEDKIRLVMNEYRWLNHALGAVAKQYGEFKEKNARSVGLFGESHYFLRIDLEDSGFCLADLSIDAQASYSDDGLRKTTSCWIKYFEEKK